MKLLELYSAILKVAKLTTDDDGYVSNVLMDNKKPFIISGKRLVLPTTVQLRNPDKESRIVFHPLRENALQTGESEVLSSFRVALNTRINGAVALLLANLVNLAVSVPEHKKLNSDQMEYLTLIKKADEKTFKDLQKIIEAMPLGQNKKAFVSIYLKKGAKLNGQTYKKAGIVSFPFYTEIAQAKTEVYGVKLRQKDILGLKELMEYIFGSEIATLNSYSYGSSSDVAPSIESIMGAIKNLGIAINDKVDNFKNIFEDCDEMMVSSDWVEAFDSIEKFLPEIRMIPSQFGNEPTQSAPVEVQSIASPTNVKIPVKEKLTFAALPGSQQNNQMVNTGLGLVSQGGTTQGTGLGLSAAMASMRSAGMVNTGIGVRPTGNVFAGGMSGGFAALPNNSINNNPFAVGFTNQGSGLSFVTSRL